ncbi:hypothetical protein AGMMS49965_16460 [Bacteroidia bacterium]|nr:hypothetical protein AGMMS49965_16460 [Bacteroidia bacterium]
MEKIFMRNFSVALVALLLLAACDNKRKGKPKRGEVVTTTVVFPPPDVSVEKPVVNVYIENSGSMDGYVKGKTDFEHAVYSYLSDIKISGIANSINLFYINSKIIPHGSDIEDFIDKLEPTTFQKRGGNRGTTDIANVLKTVLKATNDKIVSIFVSDFVFSPGGKNKNADEYLINQQIGIKTDVAEHIKQFPQTAFTIYRLTSHFNGTYYNCYDAKTQINARRPFFIWLIGNVDYIATLQNKIPNNNFMVLLGIVWKEH